MDKISLIPPLSERMRIVAGMVPEGCAAADIGCDHGYIAIFLVNSGRSSSCIAADVREEPLRAAAENIKRYKAVGKVRPLLSDGLEKIKDGDAGCFILAGMGGSLIIDIISRGIEKAKNAVLVLEPQSDAPAVRRFLYENFFVISKEELVIEKGKYYPVMCAKYTGESSFLSDEEYEYGPCLLKNKNTVLRKFLLKEEKRLSEIEKRLEGQKGAAAEKRRSSIQTEMEVLNKAMQGYKKVVLASGSPRRRQLLEQIGIEAEVIPSSADEDADIKDPAALVLELSHRKCEDVAKNISDGIVIGADTVVSIDGTVLGKPSGKEGAAAMLAMLSGRTHQVYTGVMIINKSDGREMQRKHFFEKTDVTFSKLDRREIEEYVATGEPLDKAGAYGIQGGFAKYVERINGDYFNVVGLPLAQLYAELKEVLP